MLTLGVIAGLSLAAKAEPAQRLPLIHAGLSICAPIGPQGGDEDEDEDGPGAGSRPRQDQGPQSISADIA